MPDRPKKTPSGFIDEGRPVDLATISDWNSLWNRLPENQRFWPQSRLSKLGWISVLDDSDGHLVCIAQTSFARGEAGFMRHSAMVHQFAKELSGDGVPNIYSDMARLVPDYYSMSDSLMINAVTRTTRNASDGGISVESVVDGLIGRISSDHERNSR
jgi:hypothetical protein